MMEIGGSVLLGLVVFGIGVLRMSPIRPGERTAEVVLAIISGLALLGMVLGGTDGGTARLAGLWVGAVCGYGICRLLPKRAPEPPRMSAEYHAATRRIDEAFEAVKADSARGPSPDDLDRTKAHFREIDRGFEELQREGERMRSRSKQVTLGGVIMVTIFLAYLVVQYLKA